MSAEGLPTAVPADLLGPLATSAARMRPFGVQVVHVASVGSTNDLASQLAGGGAAEGTLVIADAQTAGRGRMGHTWYSPPLAGLYVSAVLRPDGSWLTSAPELVGLITLAAGVALAEGVRAASNVAAMIKWPNDIVVGRDEADMRARNWRKLAGILAEGAAVGGELQHVVLGYGVNLCSVACPPALAARVTSIEGETGRPIERATVLVETLAALAHWYGVLIAGDTPGVLARWRALSPSSEGAPVAWTRAARRVEGVTAGVDHSGALLVQSRDGRTEAIRSGEVVWL